MNVMQLYAPLLIKVTAVAGVFWAAAATASEPSGFLETAIYEKIARSTARVVNGNSSGTAWVVDHKQRLLITNFHVVAVKSESAKDYRSAASHVKLSFPRFVEGKVAQSSSLYRDAKTVNAEVIGTSMKSDLALLKADTLPSGAAALELASEDPKPGSRVHSVGHPRGSDAWWVYSNGTVRAVARYKDHSEFGSADFQSVETQSPVNKGDSGGAMVNDDGKVVAVVQGYATEARLVSFAVAAPEVRKLISSFHTPSAANSATAHYNRAIVLFDRREYRAAIVELDKAIALDSNRRMYHFFRGHAHHELNQNTTAIADIERGLAVKSNGSVSLLDQGYGYNLLGQIYVKRGAGSNSSDDYRLAIDAFDKAVAKFCTDPILYYNRGWAKQQLNRYQEAIADYEACLSQNPKQRKAWIQRGYAQISLKRYSDAVAGLSKGIRLFPDSDGLRLARGNAYYHLRNYDAALADWLNAKQLAPPGSDSYRKAVDNLKLIRK